MNGRLVAWIVLVVSGFYLLDRALIWSVSRAWSAYRKRHARLMAARRLVASEPPHLPPDETV